jgi:hypothetical protein
MPALIHYLSPEVLTRLGDTIELLLYLIIAIPVTLGLLKLWRLHSAMKS